MKLSSEQNLQIIFSFISVLIFLFPFIFLFIYLIFCLFVEAFPIIIIILFQILNFIHYLLIFFYEKQDILHNLLLLTLLFIQHSNINLQYLKLFLQSINPLNNDHFRLHYHKLILQNFLIFNFHTNQSHEDTFYISHYLEVLNLHI